MRKLLPFTYWIRLIAVAGVGVLVAGCGPKTLETSSVEKLEKSLTTLREQIELEQRDRLDESLKYLVGESAIMDEEADPSHPRFILTVWGVGYRFPTTEELTT